MATSLKAPCASCDDKAPGIFRCEGCVQVFCRKHLNEHRDHLSLQLDEIILEHDTIQHAILKNKQNKNDQHPIFKQIDQWERDSIGKIQRMAKEARNTANKLINSDAGTFYIKVSVNMFLLISKELHDIAERLQKARLDDDYVETDLRTWTEMLHKLKENINSLDSSVSIQEDRTNILIGKIRISTEANKKLEILRQRDRFGEVFINVRVDNGGLRAMHNGPKNGTAYARGTEEYSSGKHCIRFLFENRDVEYITHFSIASKLTALGNDQKYKEYGWNNRDETLPGNTEEIPVKIQDLQGCKQFAVELELDCDNRKVAYLNLETRNRKEMNVDIVQCPFPWQIQFYFYVKGDCVTLLD